MGAARGNKVDPPIVDTRMTQVSDFTCLLEAV